MLQEIGAHFCHQLPERSLLIGGRQMFVCARCTGFYAGVLVALLAIYLLKEHKAKGLNFWMLAALLFPMAADGLAQLIGFSVSNNIVRLWTGLLGGFVFAYLIAFAFGHVGLAGKKARHAIPTWHGFGVAVLASTILAPLLWKWPTAGLEYAALIGMFISFGSVIFLVAYVVYKGFRF